MNSQQITEQSKETSMAEIEIKVSGAVARVVRKPEVITAGTVGLMAAFTFDAGWDGLSKTAVFSAGNVTRDVVGIGTGPVAVPHEVLAVPMRELLAGVYGVNADGTRATPTIWARVDQIRPGANPSGDESTDPSLMCGRRSWQWSATRPSWKRRQKRAL